MKKIFSIFALSAITLTAMAGVIETGTFDSGSLVQDNVPQGTVLGASANITCKYMPCSLYAGSSTQPIKKSSAQNGPDATYDFRILFDDTPLLLTDGIAGNVNGNKTGGWELCFEVGAIESWGELYVAAKLTGSKQYVVVEESSTGASKYIPCWIITNSYDAGSVQFMTPYDESTTKTDPATGQVTDVVPFDEENWAIDVTWEFQHESELRNLDKVNTEGTAHGHTAPAATGKNGAGVIFFDVQPNCKYYVFAAGSKIPVSGWAFCNGDLVKDIKVEARDKNAEVPAGSDYVVTKTTYLLKDGTIKAALDANAQ